MGSLKKMKSFYGIYETHKKMLESKRRKKTQFSIKEMKLKMEICLYIQINGISFSKWILQCGFVFFFCSHHYTGTGQSFQMMSY